MAVADTPLVRRALRTPDPSRTIQPFAERVRRDSGTDFVVVMSNDRVRYSHPDPARIGGRFIGDLGTAPQGRPFTEEYTGTLGPSMRAVVPVESSGRVVALVSVGITMQRIQDALLGRLPTIGFAAAVILAAGLLGAWLISRRLRRQTHGMGEREITRMYEYYDAVLHAVREGLLLVDADGRVQLVNEEATRLLGLGEDHLGRPVGDLGLPEPLTRAVLSTDRRPDEIHLVDDRVLVVNSSPARWQGHEVGSVVTLRDHTELQAVAGELDTVRGLAESLRSQNHEAANRLHTVVSLVELGRTAEAVEFATEELQVAQLLTDRVVGSVSDPVVSALLLGKTAQAAERGVQLRLRDDVEVTGLPVEQRDAVTMLGNLLDNAIDAVGETAEGADRVVLVELTGSPVALHLRVSDSGAGLSPALVRQVFERGWSTKAADGPVGRGLGLALVVQAVRRYGGRIEVARSPLGGAAFDIRIGAPVSPPGRRDVRVLVVEDEELSAQAHADYVRRTAGFEVAGVARSSVEALRALRAEGAADRAVDLVLLDMQLPDGHGLGLLRAIRAEGHLCDVIAVTAARDVEVVKRAVAQGVVLYLLKPFTYAGFRGKLEQYADYRARLGAGGDALGQDEVDRVLGVLRTAPRHSTIPKGMSVDTLREVTLALRDGVGRSASELAGDIGTSRVTARRYLEYLADEQVVERSVRYGGSGRPEVEYRWTGA